MDLNGTKRINNEQKYDLPEHNGTNTNRKIRNEDKRKPEKPNRIQRNPTAHNEDNGTQWYPMEQTKSQECQ